jgi:hypothetical protein
VSRTGIKGLDPVQNGKKLYSARRNRAPDPDPHLVPEIYTYGILKRVVEVYSKTLLTNPEDKLALSGISKMMSREFDDQYIAGMWRKNLEGQFLWRVEPLFKNGPFSYLSKRPRSIALLAFVGRQWTQKVVLPLARPQVMVC